MNKEVCDLNHLCLTNSWHLTFQREFIVKNKKTLIQQICDSTNTKLGKQANISQSSMDIQVTVEDFIFQPGPYYDWGMKVNSSESLKEARNACAQS